MRPLVSADGQKFRGFAISPDSQKIVVGRDSDPRVQLHDLQTGKLETIFSHSLSYVEKITFGFSGRWFAVSDNSDELAILDINNPENPQTLHSQVELDPTTNFGVFGFSENDEYFAASASTGMNDKYKIWTLLWKRKEDAFVFQYVWEGSVPISPSAFTTSPDGSTVLATIGGGEIQIWNLLPDAPQLFTTLNGVDPIQFSSDGRFLFDNRDDYIQIWDWQTSRPISHLPIPGFTYFSQNGSVLVSPGFGYTGQYLVWDIKNLLSDLHYSIEPHGKKLVTLGQVKQNQLLQNFPNPFNPETWIPFRLANESNVTIHIYTTSGKLVRSLSPGIMPAGDYSSQSKAVHWDGQNDAGESVSSGVYLYTIKAGNFSTTRKMLIQK